MNLRTRLGTHLTNIQKVKQLMQERSDFQELPKNFRKLNVTENELRKTPQNWK